MQLQNFCYIDCGYNLNDIFVINVRVENLMSIKKVLSGIVLMAGIVFSGVMPIQAADFNRQIDGIEELINNQKFIERAEIIREKGTDRSKFFRGEVDKYTWVDVGSSFLSRPY